MNVWKRWVREGALALDRGDLHAAERCYRLAQVCDRGNRAAWPSVGLARVALLRGQLAECENLLRATLHRFPQCAPAMITFALAALAHDRPESSLAWLERAASIEPTNGEVFEALGLTLAQVGLWSEAKRAARRSVELEPERARFRRVQGEILMKSGELAAAAPVFSRCVELEPEQLEHRLQLADVLTRSGSDREADATLAQASRRFPTATQPHLRRAELARRRRDEASAAHHLAAGEKSRTRGEQALLTAAWMHARLFDQRAAEKALREALALNPHSGPAYAALGTLLRSQDRLDEAEACFRAALRWGSTDWKPSAELAALLEGSHREAEAMAVLEAACRGWPDHQVFACWWALARLRLRSGDPGGARRAAERALAGPPGTAPVENARRLLTALRPPKAARAA